MNYCNESGKSKQDIKNDLLYLNNVQDKICINCNTQNTIKSNYCRSCGNNLEKICEEKLKNNKILDLKNMLKSVDIVKILITTFLSILILFLISYATKIFIDFKFGDVASIINPINIIMAFNLSYINVSSTSMFGSTNISASIGILLLLLVPVFALTISNIIFMKKENKDAKSVIVNSFSIGIVYALILTILSIFSKSIINPYDVVQYGMSFSIKYIQPNVFINGFIIAFLCTYVIGMKRKYLNDNVYLYIFKKAINSIVLGYAIVLLILVVMTLFDSSYLYEFGMYGYTEDVGIATIVSQLAIYIWAFANFIPVIISKYSISVFNLLLTDLFLDTKLVFISVIAISFLIILVTGCNLKQKYKDNKINTTLIFSLFYALIMGVLSHFSLILINNSQESIILGFSLIQTIVISFIYSFIVSNIGYKLYVFE